MRNSPTTQGFAISWRAAAVAAAICAGMSGQPVAAPGSLPNLALPTLGGKQFWADRYLYSGWRIQENVLTGHSRLLAPDNVRRCWGSFDACRRAFEEIRVDRDIPPYDGHLVILVHGLGRSPASFGGLKRALGENGYQVAAIAYPSTRRSLGRNAESLKELVENLEGVDRVSFVTHSLGGLLVRELLARGGDWRDRIEVGAVVMTASPSRGAAIADALSGVPPFSWILGEGLVAATRAEASSLPAPDVPFGIVAAGRGGTGYNPFLSGDDDLLVTVDETRLDGAADWLYVSGAHTFVMNHPETVEATLNFLDHGTFGPVPSGRSPQSGG